MSYHPGHRRRPSPGVFAVLVAVVALLLAIWALSLQATRRRGTLEPAPAPVPGAPSAVPAPVAPAPPRQEG